MLLGKEINTKYFESKPFIASDERFLLFVRYGMPASINGGRGLYISLRNKDYSRTKAQLVNIRGSLPKITPDGKYFFFTSKRSGNGDIYWVDAKIINDFNERTK